ncbi:hypothetical protein EW026_g4597 [Hermanssonia centrifuga]|uniref:DUF6533 domain-containing protein n=1 Tax=Hermanssonia centrifuga TaxID=98765 RepID=A0A4S4KHP6_9APHY|nr:hypothetical protein EW026_g4597 [Hermanssonia centrifuga]
MAGPSAQDLIVIADKRAVTTAAGAALSWMIWDTIIHFDVEVECIWRRPKLWVKIAYAFIRWLTIFHAGAVLTLNGSARFSTSGCRGWLIHELVYMEVLTLVVEVILVMRLYVLYNQNKIILWAMITFFIGEISMMIAVLAIVLPRMTFDSDCLVAAAPSFFMAYWLSSLAFETFLFVLTLVAFFKSVKREHGRHSILYVFVRDGTWAFALIFVCLLLNTLMYRLNKNPLAGMGYYWGLSVMSFAGSHVLLNIRRLGIPNYLSVTTLPTIHFNTGARPVETGLTTTVDTHAPSDGTESTAVDSVEMSALSLLQVNYEDIIA